jgi:lipopolysaccharide biosynthesis protein
MKLAHFAAKHGLSFAPVEFYLELTPSSKRRRAGSSIAFTSDDPQLHVVSAAEGIDLPEFPQFVCVARHLSGAFTGPCLYLDRGEGFSEAATSKTPAQLHSYGDTLVFVGQVAKGAGLRAVRFDPAHGACAFEVVGAGWTDERGVRAILEAANKLRFARPGPRAARFVYRLLPTGKSTKLRWARRLFPRSWLYAIDPAGGMIGGRGGGIATGLPAFFSADRFASIYWDYWNQANGTGYETLRGALSAKPVNAERCDVKLIAYYLPQFHPIPENDSWWGRGFTEWRNVTKAAPVFVDHYQPKLPGELGFYDLRVADVMHRQVELARLYGIAAFCFHFYWFAGKRLLENPILQYLENQDLDLPFCLCWANENWTRRWDGAERELLIGQQHSEADDLAFIRYLKRYFDDPRYLKIDGKPVLTVYRPGILPDAGQTAARWRAEVVKMGFPGIYLVATNSFGFSDCQKIGFDALSEFPPHGLKAPIIRDRLQLLNHEHSGAIFSYADVVDMPPGTVPDQSPIWPGVMPAWDNCARMPKGGHVFHESTPRLFREWLDKAMLRARENPADERFVIINAWNEWAEGAYLEPDRRFGYAYLAACGSAIADHSTADEEALALFAKTRERFRASRPRAIVLHLFYENMAKEFARYLDAFANVDVYLTVPRDVSIATAHDIAAKFPGAYIQEVENRGRDMLPFLTILDVVRRGNHEFVCKLHTKRSPHIDDGSAWREELVGSLLSPAARKMLDAVGRAPEVGILASKGALASLSDEPVRRHSEERIRLFAARLGTKVNFDEPFVAGSMFWFRPEAMKSLIGLVSEEDFEPELGQIDGTLAHALERMTVIAARRAGFDVAEIDAETVTARQY